MPDISEELLRRVQGNEPAALWEYSRLIEADSPDEAYKFAVLAAQLNQPDAAMYLGDRCAQEEKPDDAERYYRIGIKAGVAVCAVKLALIHLSKDEPTGLVELEELAEMGEISAAEALADYYKAHRNEVQYEYWSLRVKDE
ncbi:MAG: hypothetical protein J1F33_03865 [Clostridiales bacterium]|nr:hypothetical protein [Clostridiales bacterium]